MTLMRGIEVMQEKMLPQIPEKIIDAFREATEKLNLSGIVDRCLKPGDIFPPFSLPNATGKIILSEDLFKKGILVINFYRGGWCPYCNLELNALQQIRPEISKHGARLVAISPETPDNSLRLMKRTTWILIFFTIKAINFQKSLV